MKPVMQTVEGGKGNCFNACIASLLNLNLEDIPLLEAFEDGGWIAELNEWLYPRGLVYFDIRVAKDEAEVFFADKDFFHVLTGPSPRLSGFDHSVVGRKGKMVHDPHPDGTGLKDGPTYLTIGILVARCAQETGLLNERRRNMEQNEAQGRLSGMKICREKYWEELSDSEKVERMRGEVKRLMRSVDCLMRSSNNMKAHKHLDGDIVIPLGFYAGGEPEKSSRDEKYF